MPPICGPPLASDHPLMSSGVCGCPETPPSRCASSNRWDPAASLGTSTPKGKRPLPSVPITSCSLRDVVVMVMRRERGWRHPPHACSLWLSSNSGSTGGSSKFCKPPAFLLHGTGRAPANPALSQPRSTCPQTGHSLPSQCPPHGTPLLKPCSSLSPSPGCASVPTSPPVSGVVSFAFFPLLFQTGSSSRPETVSYSCICANRGGSRPGAAAVKLTFTPECGPPSRSSSAHTLLTAWNASPYSLPVTNPHTGMSAAPFLSTILAIFTGTGEESKVNYSPILWMSKIRPKQAKGLAPDYRASGLLS